MLIIQSKRHIQPHIGKQPIARWYFPPEVDYRLSLLPPDAKGLVVWIIEAKVLGFFFAEYEVLLSDHEKCDSSFCVCFPLFRFCPRQNCSFLPYFHR